MNTLVIYFTKFGNTRKVAETIAATLAKAGTTRAVSVDEMATSDWENADLLVMGSPTHYQNLPKDVRSLLAMLPRRCMAGKCAVAFDTSIKTWGPLMRLTAAHRLQRILRKLGGKTVVPPETFLVERDFLLHGAEELRQDTLCDGELEHAKEWAMMLLKRLEVQGLLQPDHL